MSTRPTIEGGGTLEPVGKTFEEVEEKTGPAPDDFVYKPTPSGSESDDPWATGGGDAWGEEGSSTANSFWEGWVENYVKDELREAGNNLGLDWSTQLLPYVNSIMDETLGYVRTNWSDYLQGTLFPNLEDPVPVLDSRTRAALDTLGLAALNHMKDTQPELMEMWRYGRSDPFNPRRRSGGRGSGRALSAADFDLDYLTEQVQEVWRAYLLDDHKDPRSLASAYVNARVANPETPIELDTFILKRIRNTGRYKSIYRSKPEGVDELSFMQRYLQSARQYLSEDDAQRVAIGGAQFNASPGAFTERISKERAVQTTAPFISGLEQMLSDVNGVLRG